MKALVCQQPGSFEYVEKASLEIQPGRSLLKGKRVSTFRNRSSCL